MTDKPTPLTDAAPKIERQSLAHGAPPFQYVDANFARDLERQLTAAHEQCAEWRDQWKGAEAQSLVLLDEAESLRAQLTAARAEAEALRAQLQEAAGQIEHLDMQNNALRNQAEVTQKDAERYRFLRGDGGPASARWPRWRIEHWSGVWNPVQSDGMDAAIDNAMKGEGRE